MKTALITSTGSVAADIAIKSLKRMGVKVVGCNIYPQEWVVESNEVHVFHKIPPVSHKNEYLISIKKICQDEAVNFILPMIDYEIDLLSSHREWFEDREMKLCISSKETLDIVRNKKKLEDFVALECPQLNPIPTMMMRDVLKIEWEFPIVCKPYNGRSSQGLTYIQNEEEWEEFKKSANNDIYIVEPFVDGPIVMVEVIRQSNPHKVVAMTRREILSTPHGCSTCVYIYQDKQLEENTKELADKLNIIGDVNFEYILDKNGRYHLVECNPRFSAGCEFSCIAGYDCVENHMKCFMGEEIEDYHFKHNMVISRKYEEYITAVNTIVPYDNTHH